MASSNEHPLFEFGGDYVRVCVYLPKKNVKSLKREFKRVTGVQPPLIESFKNGFSLFIPWVQEEKK